MLITKSVQQKIDIVLECKKNIGLNCVTLGKVLKELRDSKEYLSCYGTWSEFLQKGVDISERSAYRFIRVIESFDEETIAIWGANKLDLLLSAEEPARREIFKLHQPSDTREAIAFTVKRLGRENLAQFNETKDEKVEIVLPAQNFFFETEMLLHEVAEKLQRSRDNFNSCKMNEIFVQYGRKKVIEDLVKLIKGEAEHL